MFAGALLTRGLGSPLLVTRGLGGFALVITIPVERPRQLRTQGAGGRTTKPVTQQQVVCYFINARLVAVNDQELTRPIEGSVKVCYGQDMFRVTSALPSVKRRRSGLRVRARLVTTKGQKP